MIPPLTDSDPEWNFDMSAAPHGCKLIALNPGKVAVFAVLSSRNLKDFIGWYPLPRLPKNHAEVFLQDLRDIREQVNKRVVNKMFQEFMNANTTKEQEDDER